MKTSKIFLKTIKNRVPQHLVRRNRSGNFFCLDLTDHCTPKASQSALQKQHKKGGSGSEVSCKKPVHAFLCTGVDD